MSEETQTAAVVAAATDTSTQSTPAQPAAQPAQQSEQEPAWLSSRLERERKSMLKQLGVENVEDARVAIDELKKRRASEQTEQDRLKAENAELAAKAKRLVDLESVIAAKATYELSQLTAEQKSAVEDIAGSDAAAQLRAVEKLRPTWVKPSATAAPLPAPASTSTTATAPAPTASQSENHLATWETLQKKNPVSAAAYLNKFSNEIFTARQARK